MSFLDNVYCIFLIFLHWFAPTYLPTTHLNYLTCMPTCMSTCMTFDVGPTISGGDKVGRIEDDGKEAQERDRSNPTELDTRSIPSSILFIPQPPDSYGHTTKTPSLPM
jgi:hypothetical protein